MGSLLGGGIGSIIGGLFGQTTQAPNYNQLLAQNQTNYNNQLSMAQGLPSQINAQFPGYQQQGQAAAGALNNAGANVNQNLTNAIGQLYSPTGPAVTAAQNANQMAQYANVPASQNAVAQSLAASGGFQRGNAGVQMAQPVLQAAQRTGLGNQQIQAQNLQQGQQAQQQAASQIANLSDAQAQSIFGMSAQQANNMLQYGTQAQIQSVQDALNASQQYNQANLGILNAQQGANYATSAAQSQLNNQMLGGLGQLAGAGLSLLGNGSGAAPGAMTGGNAATGLYPQMSGMAGQGEGATDLGGTSWGF